MTEENLSATFGMPLRLSQEAAGRYAARRRTQLNCAVGRRRIGFRHGLVGGARWPDWLAGASLLGVAEMFSLDLILPCWRSAPWPAW